MKTINEKLALMNDLKISKCESVYVGPVMNKIDPVTNNVDPIMGIHLVDDADEIFDATSISIIESDVLKETMREQGRVRNNTGINEETASLVNIDGKVSDDQIPMAVSNIRSQTFVPKSNNGVKPGPKPDEIGKAQKKPPSKFPAKPIHGHVLSNSNTSFDNTAKPVPRVNTINKDSTCYNGPNFNANDVKSNERKGNRLKVNANRNLRRESYRFSNKGNVFNENASSEYDRRPYNNVYRKFSQSNDYYRNSNFTQERNYGSSGKRRFFR